MKFQGRMHWEKSDRVTKKKWGMPVTDIYLISDRIRCGAKKNMYLSITV